MRNIFGFFKMLFLLNIKNLYWSRDGNNSEDRTVGSKVTFFPPSGEKKFVFAGQKFWKWETKVEETSATKFASLLRQCRSRRYCRSQWNHPPKLSTTPDTCSLRQRTCNGRVSRSNFRLEPDTTHETSRIYRAIVSGDTKRMKKKVKKKKCFASSSRSRKREFRRLVSLERRKII